LLVFGHVAESADPERDARGAALAAAAGWDAIVNRMSADLVSAC
jgi:hypothetical protein